MIFLAWFAPFAGFVPVFPAIWRKNRGFFVDTEKWIEIARTGTFTDSAGRKQTFTNSDLDAIVSAWNPAKRDCPLVLGHPKTDATPAFGWLRKIRSEGGKLLASFGDVPEQARKLVADGLYRHVSMSLMPDRVTLRHVALLGAAQPAIDGLKAVEFGDSDNCITVEFAARDGGSLAKGAQQTPRSLQAPLECRAGSATDRYEKKEGAMPDELQRKIGQLEEQLKALKAENESLKKRVADHKQGKEKAEAAKADAESRAEKASADFAAYRGQIEKERRESRIAALVEAGKLKPAEKASVMQFATALASQSGTVDFSLPDGKTENISLEEKYFRELEARHVDGRFMDFSLPPSHASQPFVDYADIAKKLESVA